MVELHPLKLNTQDKNNREKSKSNKQQKLEKVIIYQTNEN